MRDNKLYLQVEMYEKVNGIISVTGKYIQQPELIGSIAGDVDGLEEGEFRKFIVTPIWMSEKMYSELKEFTGY